MLALAYVRRSKNSKKRPSASPERQAANIEEYCQQRGWQIEWYRDTEGHRSGLTELKRPRWLALKQRLESARKGEVAAVVVNSLDRSSRKAKDFLNFLDLCQQKAADFAAVTQPFLDTTTPYGRAMVASMMVYAQLEAEIDSQRLVEDIEYRQSEGQMWGPAPIGYSTAEKAEGSAYKLRHPDQDAPLVGRLLERYADGNVSIRQLAREANLWPASHVPGGSWRMRRRDGSRVPFTHRSVESILDNAPIYAGKVMRYAGKDGQEEYAGKHEPLIDEHLVGKILEVREKRENKRLTSARLTGVRTYLLTPLLHCAVCGAQLRGQVSKGKRVYFHQARHGWARVDAPQVEREVLDRFRALSLPEDLAERIDRHAPAAPADDLDHAARLQAQLGREKDLYALGDRTRDEYLQRKAELEREIVRLSPKQKSAAPLLDAVRGFQVLLTADETEERRRQQKTILVSIVDRIETDGTSITTLTLKPWLEAVFKAAIIVYPQPEFRDQVGLSLNGRLQTVYSVRDRFAERNQQIRIRRAAGATLRQLADAFGISVARVDQLCRLRV